MKFCGGWCLMTLITCFEGLTFLVEILDDRDRPLVINGGSSKRMIQERNVV